MSVRGFSGKAGFVRIFEVVLFAFLIFGILLPSFFKYSDPNDWGKVNTMLISHDLLFSFEKEGFFDRVLFADPKGGTDTSITYSNNIENLSNMTKLVLPAVYDFEFEIKDIPPPIISVGCICSESEKQWLTDVILTPSYPTYQFAVNTEPLNLSNLSDTFDTFVIFGQQDLDPYRPGIEYLLSKGKGFVMIANITSDPDATTKSLFNVNYIAGVSAVETMYFDEAGGIYTIDISKRYVYNLVKVGTMGANFTGNLTLKGNAYGVKQNLSEGCVEIASCSPCLYEGESCTIAGVANISLYQIDPYAGRWIDIKISSPGANPRAYDFRGDVPLTAGITRNTIVSDGIYGFANAAMGGYSPFYETEPRRFWIYGYNTNNDDLNLLLKTGIMWSSGEHFFLFNKEIPDKRNVATHFFTGLQNNSIPYTIKFYTWGY